MLPETFGTSPRTRVSLVRFVYRETSKVEISLLLLHGIPAYPGTYHAVKPDLTVSVFSTHIAHRGAGRRSHLSSLRHINHSRGGLGASCAVVSRGSWYISLQVKCNQSIYRRMYTYARNNARSCVCVCLAHRVHTHARTYRQRSANHRRSFLCRRRTDCKQPAGTMRDW